MIWLNFSALVQYLCVLVVEIVLIDPGKFENNGGRIVMLGLCIFLSIQKII